MKFGLSDTTIENIQKVFENNAKIDEVIVFGSRAKGNYKEGSDIDLAVKGSNISFDDVLKLHGQLDDLNLPYKIDLLDYATIKEPALVEHIDRVGIVFYERWKKYKFSDFVDINPTVSLKSNEEYSFVEMKDLQDGTKYCFPTAQRKLSGGARFKEGDTLFARITPCLENGKICKVKGLKNDKGFGSTEFLVFRERKDISDNDFVFYLSRWNEVRDFAERHFEGTSGRQRVPKDSFDNLFLNLPPYEEQTSIASILSSLDDKIDLLQRQNKTLEQLAETLFRQWFVEEADESWETNSLHQHIEVFRGLSYKGSGLSEAEGMPMHNLNSVFEFGGYKNEGIKFYTGEYRDRHILNPGDIIVTNTEQGHEFRLIGFPAIVPDSFGNTGIFSQHIYRVTLLKKTYLTNQFIYYLLMIQEMRQQIVGATNGSTVNMLAIDGLQIPEFKLPPKEKVLQFSIIAKDYWNKKDSNFKQIKQLTQLRNALLPKLMSGEVRVNQ